VLQKTRRFSRRKKTFCPTRDPITGKNSRLLQEQTEETEGVSAHCPRSAEFIPPESASAVRREIFVVRESVF
jgi:hypothetical protein